MLEGQHCSVGGLSEKAEEKDISLDHGTWTAPEGGRWDTGRRGCHQEREAASQGRKQE